MSKELTFQSHDEATFRQNCIAMFHMGIKAIRQGVAVESALRRVADLRSLSQNAKLWPMLEDVAAQQQLVIDGVLEWASREDWKDVFTASLKKHQRMARGIDGGIVMLGMRTSKMRKAEFSDLIELIYAYGAENGVAWSEKAQAIYDEYKEAA